jgi:hypothetical protein
MAALPRSDDVHRHAALDKIKQEEREERELILFFQENYSISPSSF